MAKTLSEITKIDPQFNKDKFIHECEFEIIPSVLEVQFIITIQIDYKCFFFSGLPRPLKILESPETGKRKFQALESP